jgi:ethanolamine kinase
VAIADLRKHSFFELLPEMSVFCDNPNEVLDESVDLNSSDLESQVLSVVSKIVHQDLVKLNYQIEHLSGGNTNILYRVFSPSLHDQNDEQAKCQYVIRLYGIGTEDFIDRSTENIIFSALSKAGISPPFVGLFNNGRVEGYINARSLSPDEFSLLPIGRSIAQTLANFQNTKIDDIDHTLGLWKKLHVFFSLAQGHQSLCFFLSLSHCHLS